MMKYDPKTGMLTIVIPYDPTMDYPLSKSGKNRNVATTNGFASVSGCDLRVGLNVIAPLLAAEPAAPQPGLVKFGTPRAKPAK